MDAKQLIEKAGGARAVANATGGRITQQAVYQWKRVPGDWVPLMASLTGLPEREIRPDMYEHEKA